MALINNASGVYATLGFNFNDPNGTVQEFSANTQANLEQFPPIINEWQATDLKNNDVGGYYQNPVVAYLNTIMLTSNTICVAIANAYTSTGTDGNDQPLPPSYVGPSLTAVATAANSVTIAANNMIFHTDKVSGVTPMEGKEDTHINPYYKTLTAYGKQAIYITNQTDGIVDNSPILGSLTSLLVVPQFKDYASNVISILTKVNTIIAANSDSTGAITGITSKLNELNAFMIERQGHDVAFFTNVKNMVNRFNEMRSFSSSGETEKYLLNNVLGTDKIKSRLLTTVNQSNTATFGTSQYSDFWSKSLVLTPVFGNGAGVMERNWGLYRSWYGSNPDITWGSTSAKTDLSGSVSLKASGRGVDVVVVDGVIDPNHPEFAVSPDGTGGSRVKYFNWYSLNIPNDPMQGSVYNPPITTNRSSSSDDSRHAVHVAGIVAGNTQGWARNANIYNISPQYVTGGVQYAYLYKYILYWHNQKRAAGNMTPTIVNNSWISRYTVNYTAITSVTYQGSTVAGPFTINQLASYGITVDSDNIARIPLRNAAMDADIQDCINAGIIMVAAAGNNYYRMTTDSSDVNYNNTVTATGANSGNPIYYSRGQSPGATPGVICVGAISSSTDSPGADKKANFSHRGPRVDVFAPGAVIASAFLTTVITNQGALPTPVADNRNSNYYIAKLSGTSMASPQVCGVLACALEITPTMNQAAALAYITQNAGINQIPTTTGGVTDVYDLLGAPNRYLAVPSDLKGT